MADRNRLRMRVLSLRKTLIQNPGELLGFEYSNKAGEEPLVADIVKMLLLEFPEYSRMNGNALEEFVSREVQRIKGGAVVTASTPSGESTVNSKSRGVGITSVGSSAPQVAANANLAKKRIRDDPALTQQSSSPIGGAKLRAPIAVSSSPLERFDDLCGLDPKTLFVIQNQVILPLTNQVLCGKFLKSMPCPGVLICGSAGSGKSLFARAIAGESCASFFPVSSTEIVAGISGESEEKIRQIFEAAKSNSPSIIVFDDIDVICPRSANRDLERRIVAQIQNCMDSLSKHDGFVAVVATTSKPEVVDSSLRRSGRFDIEISLGMPDLVARKEILSKAIAKHITASICGVSVNLDEVAKRAAGFVGADLIRLVRETGMCAIKRWRLEEESTMEEDCESEVKLPVIIMSDFITALKYIEPSSRREGFSSVPSQTWEDVGSLESIKGRLEQAVCLPIRRADLFAQLCENEGMAVPISGNDGVLLYGPPGCGKTLLAKAVANASGASFISVKGPELLNKYVGESERAVRQVFERARISPPCVIFFDELDALCPRRDGSSGGNGAAERVVNQMLTEMDGAGESNKGVIVIGATNRPDMVDPAMLRPGRLGLLMYVPLPDEKARENILKTLVRKTKMDAGVDLNRIAKATPRFSGADMACLVRSAVTEAVVRLDQIRHEGLGPSCSPSVTMSDFENARISLRASVSAEEEQKYLALRERIENGVEGYSA